MTFKEFKKKYKLTNRQIAKDLNMSQRTVESWSMGARNIPQWELFLLDFYYKNTIPAQRKDFSEKNMKGVEEL